MPHRKFDSIDEARMSANQAMQCSSHGRDGRVIVTPTEGPLGAVVDCGDLREIGAAATAAIRQAFLDNLVVVFREQTLSDAELVAFARRFGEFEYSENPLPSPLVGEGKVRQGGRIAEFPQVTVVSNVVEDGVALGGLGDGEVVWHTDRSNFAATPNQTMLYALECPPAGGMTGFCNMYLALENLPAALRARVEGLKLKHDSVTDAAGYVRKEFAAHAGADVRTIPGAIHPLVRTHPETGHDCLFLGRRSNAYLVGLELADSEDLLDRLWLHATQPRFTWHHHWRPGDLVMWDNRCVLHRREPFAASARRLMHRVMLKGTPPFHGHKASAPHPRGRQ